MLKAASWDVLCGHPVPTGLLPKIWVTIMGLRLQWGVSLLCHLMQALWATPFQILLLFPTEGNTPSSKMPFKLL